MCIGKGLWFTRAFFFGVLTYGREVNMNLMLDVNRVLFAACRAVTEFPPGICTEGELRKKFSYEQ